MNDVKYLKAIINRSIIQLWLHYRDLIDKVAPDDISQDDLNIMTALMGHNVIRNAINKLDKR